MAKTKSKNRQEIEYLRGVIRKLKAENKYYKKKLGESTEKEEENFDCPECGKNDLRILDLYKVKMLICDLCGYKEKLNGKDE